MPVMPVNLAVRQEWNSTISHSLTLVREMTSIAE